MIVDTSALLAILLSDPQAPRLLDAIVSAEKPRISVANWFEAAMVVEQKGGRLASLRFDEFLRAADIELAPVTVEQGIAARNAWRAFGRHKHTAHLNFGDCFAYALAKAETQPLLFRSHDFARTDIEPALKEAGLGPSGDAVMRPTPAAGPGQSPGLEP